MITRRYGRVIMVLLALVLAACAADPSAEAPGGGAPATPDPSAEAEEEEDSPAATGEADGEPIRIGVPNAYSGTFAFSGEGADKGIAVALEELGGEVAGHPIEVYTADNECNPEKAISAARSLVEVNDVDLFLGAGCSSSTLATMTILEELGIPQIVSVSSSPVIYEDSGVGGNEWNFVHAVGSPILAQELATYAAEQVGSVALLANNDDFGRGAVSQLQPTLEEQGVAITAIEYYDIGAPDFRPLLLNIRQSNPEGFLIVAGETDAVVIMRQFRELGLTQRLFGLGTIATPLFLELSADEPGLGDGLANIAWYTEGMDPEFDAAYEARWNEPPIPNASQMYYAMRYIVPAAIEEAAAAGEVNGESLRDALETISVETPQGLIDFSDDHHQAYHNIALVTIEGDAIQLQNTIETSPSE